MVKHTVHHTGSDECIKKNKRKLSTWCISHLMITIYFGLVHSIENTRAGFACLSNPCVFGVCIDDLNSTYSCYCIDGYTGVQCQTNWDECWSSPCQNGATCIDGVAQYNCSCPEGFVGHNCEENLDECLSNPCQNGGTCHDKDNGYICNCSPGYLGLYCEHDVAVCNTGNGARCHNGGECIEGPGLEYSCKCSPGWRGIFCDNEINKCGSSPCQNGGVCVDKLATYSCACTMGYTGTNCEEEVLMCNESPCKNSALCLMEEGQPVCYCVPDFHGEKCEYQYDECQLGPRCINGGTCIDGVDDFSCSCPPNLTGMLCECLILSDGDLDCNYTRTDDIFLTSTTTFYETTMTTDNYENVTTTLSNNASSVEMETTITSTKKSLPETTTDSDIECFTRRPSHSSSTSAPTIDQHTTTITTPFDNAVTTSITENIQNTTTGTKTSHRKYTTVNEMSSMGLTTGFETDAFDTTTQTTITTHFKTAAVTSTLITADTETTKVNDIYETTVSGLMTRDVDEGSQTTGTSKFMPKTTLSEHTTINHDYETTTETNLYSSDTTIQTFFTETPGNETSTVKIPSIGHGVASSSQGTTKSQVLKTTTMSNEFITTTIPTTRSTISVTKGQTITTQPPTTTTTTTTTEAPTTKTTTKVTPTTVTSTTKSTTHIIDQFTPITENYTGTPDCIQVPCFYGGTCVNTSEGPRCVCRFDRGGPLCESPVIIRNAAFAGDSYISHRIDEKLKPDQNNDNNNINNGITQLTSGLRMEIELNVRTRATDGLILLTTAQAIKGGHYMALFLNKGLLQFQFSCGLQTMLLSELEAPVNTGHMMVIQAALDFSRNHSHCNASLRVNDTLAMSGDQPTWMNLLSSRGQSVLPMQSTWLHLGGAPQAPIGLINDLPTGQGFTGCMYSLKINGKPKQIFSDALDGFGITECGSLACLSNPCRNGGICIEMEIDDVTTNMANNDRNTKHRKWPYGIIENNNNNNNNKNIENNKQEHRDKWKCKCPTGYMGATCEISVCDDNPCQYGGTCVTFPGSGYLCLCPLGKHGHYCEHNLEISQPSFSGSIKGLASYVAYPVPIPLEYTMELSFKISPTSLSQISMLVFLGQNGYHDEKSDHLAVSFIQGYIMLTWNLGGGPRRIFTQQPIDFRTDGKQIPHTISIGRTGRTAWLSVDGKVNITGRSPGTLTRLNVSPILYLGGHSVANFSTLPHDLPLHTGFQGCIFDVRLKAGLVDVPLQETRGVRGRSVGQCGIKECHRHSCQHDGACIQYGATFTCICQEGWFGPLCAQSSNPCDTDFNQCHKDSTCVPLITNYECDCATGKSGRDCVLDIVSLSDVSLSGRRSFLTINWPLSYKLQNISDNEIIGMQRFHQMTSNTINNFNPIATSRAKTKHLKNIGNRSNTKITNEIDKTMEINPSFLSFPEGQSLQRLQYYSLEFQIRPLSERGLLIYFGSFEDNTDNNQGFVSLSLQGGIVEFRVANTQNHVTILRSARTLAIGQWHKMKISQSGKRLSLWVEGSAVSAMTQSSGSFVNKNSPIYIGGLPDLSKLPYNSITGFPIPFRGCIRQLVVSGIRIVLNETSIIDSRNINDCDGTACGGDTCDLGGHCWLDEKLQPHCKCPDNARGDRCEIPETCRLIPCKNDGRCLSNGQCSCRNGWGGFYCEIATSKFTTPSFQGNSYLVIPPTHIPIKGKRNGPSLYIKPKETLQISLNFSTTQQNGLLFWSSNDNIKYLGLGIEDGHMKLASNLLGVDNPTVSVPAGGFVADGGWHNIVLQLNRDTISLNLDGRMVFTEMKRTSTLVNNTTNSITNEDTFYIGGFPNNFSIKNHTNNKFSKSFSGCLSDLHIGDDPQIQMVDFSSYEGENIGSCELYDDFVNL